MRRPRLNGYSAAVEAGGNDIKAVAAKAPRAAFRFLGSGIIAGASDNDPTTVTTLALIGSTTIYGLTWLIVLVIPMLMVVQAISAAIGAVTRAGLEDCIRARFGNRWALVALGTVLIVNILTLAADLEGGAAALGLLSQTDYRWWILPLAASLAALLIFATYERFAKIARLIPLVFLTYVAAAVLAHPDWSRVFRETFIPHLQFTKTYAAGAIALLGTTLTAYAYVWETIEVAQARPPLNRIGLVQVSAAAGMIIAGLSFFFIAVATGATLGVQHHVVQTAQDAAEALSPAPTSWRRCSAGKPGSIRPLRSLHAFTGPSSPCLPSPSSSVMRECSRLRSCCGAPLPAASQPR